MKFLSHDGLMHFWDKVKKYVDSSIPSELPANGGNADTVGGKSATDFNENIKKHAPEYIKSGTILTFIDSKIDSGYLGGTILISPSIYAPSDANFWGCVMWGQSASSWVQMIGFSESTSLFMKRSYIKGGTQDSGWKNINDGGNADTVDGTHAWQMQTLSNAGDTHGQNHILTCQYTDAEGMFRLKIPNHQTIVNKADYANSTGNADTVDGYHVDKGVKNTYGLRAIAMDTFDLVAGVTVMSVGDIYMMYE